MLEGMTRTQQTVTGAELGRLRRDLASALNSQRGSHAFPGSNSGAQGVPQVSGAPWPLGPVPNLLNKTSRDLSVGI